jgi:hypothetical protein
MVFFVNYEITYDKIIKRAETSIMSESLLMLVVSFIQLKTDIPSKSTNRGDAKWVTLPVEWRWGDILLTLYQEHGLIELYLHLRRQKEEGVVDQLFSTFVVIDGLEDKEKCGSSTQF